MRAIDTEGLDAQIRCEMCRNPMHADKGYNRMKYRYRVLYKPPIEELDDNNPDTWRKVFYIDKYECPEDIDLLIKLMKLEELYNMKSEYVIFEDLEKK